MRILSAILLVIAVLIISSSIAHLITDATGNVWLGMATSFLLTFVGTFVTLSITDPFDY